MKKTLSIDNQVIKPSQQLRLATLNLLHSNFEAKKRFEMLDAELANINPDIIHFQEVSFDNHNPYLFNLMNRHGYKYYHKTPDTSSPSGRGSCNLSVSKTPANFEILEPIKENESNLPLRGVLVMYTKFNNVDVVTFNAHLVWGANEHLRFEESKRINNLALKLKSQNPESVIILAGDLNTEDSSDTIRFLTGKSSFENESTKWVDAWEAKGNSQNQITSEPLGILSKNTAAEVGIKFPSMIPSRRIDYIMVQGWAYGVNGSPLTFNRFADKYVENLSISDHYGIYTDLLII